MFVDIGFEKNAFLHFWDAIPAALDSGVEEIERPERPDRKRPKRRLTAKDIPSIYPVGSEVIVQVTKGPIGTKGPRVTTNLSFAGRYLVLMPYSDRSGISRKIEDPKERARLRKILRELDIPEGIGVIIRTVGEGQRARYFVRDLRFLLEQWAKIEQQIKDQPAPARVFEEPDLVERTVRDFLTDDIDEVICDDHAAVERMMQMVGEISRRAKNRIKFYDGTTPIFETFGVQKQIDDAFHRQVWLKCGGYIVIDETEALVAIDVNTGRNKGGRDVEKTILQTNLEAADEIARQLRLRNIGGLIIGDFIDMKNRKDQQMVYQPDEGTAEARQGQDARPADFAARPDGDDAAARAGKPERFDLSELPLLRRPRHGQDHHDHERGSASRPERGHAQIPGHDSRHSSDPESRRPEAPEGGGRGTARRIGTALRRPTHVPGGSDLSSRKIRHHRRQYRRRAQSVIFWRSKLRACVSGVASAFGRGRDQCISLASVRFSRACALWQRALTPATPLLADKRADLGQRLALDVGHESACRGVTHDEEEKRFFVCRSVQEFVQKSHRARGVG